ncbi:MAG: 3'(2'),5'-bisphosphate nucleotidase [Deltaproteobacteria bacterium RBG_19FT_COMBO_58_16]|nr:MAG: 3'(2'),5'-bisphosphate nucleotidase [Deltaproteobacteria bacterium RBG_19FT_COMBO_58_16]
MPYREIMETEELLKEITALAHEAGKAILDVYSGEDFGTTYKEEGSPLTLADKAANDIIVSTLKKLTPDIPVLSEESKAAPYGERRSWGRLWIVDPLDGTKEFIKRNGEFTVNIALVEGGVPVLGVVYAPALKVTYYGVKGLGAFRRKDGILNRIFVSSYSTGGPLRVVASRSHRGAELDKFLEKVGDYEILSMGSSLKFCLVAEGSAHIYPRLGPTMEWDTAAAQCVVEAAGGQVTSLDGEPLRYNREELLNPFFMVTGNPPFPWHEYLQDARDRL